MFFSNCGFVNDKQIEILDRMLDFVFLYFTSKFATTVYLLSIVVRNLFVPEIS